MRRAALLRSVLVLLAAGGISAAIVPAAPRTALTLALDGPISGACVPYLHAAASGAFAAAGLDVSIRYPQGRGAALADLAAGTVEVCVADAVAVLGERAGGTKVTIVATLGDLSPACLASRPEAAIKTPTGLAGKRIAVDPLDGDRALFPLFLAGVGLRAEDVTVVVLDRAAGRAALAAGAVDAVLDRVEDAGAGLAVLPWAAHGFSVYGPCLAVRDEVLRARPSAIRSFVKAVLRAWEACLRDPAAAARSTAASAQLSREAAEAWLAAARFRFDTETSRSKGLGWIDPSRMTVTLEAVRGMVGQPVDFPAGAAFTTAFLPVPPVLRKAERPAAPPAVTAPLKR